MNKVTYYYIDKVLNVSIEGLCCFSFDLSNKSQINIKGVKESVSVCVDGENKDMSIQQVAKMVIKYIFSKTGVSKTDFDVGDFDLDVVFNN